MRTRHALSLLAVFVAPFAHAASDGSCPASSESPVESIARAVRVADPSPVGSSVERFTEMWNRARAEGSLQGNKVSYEELVAALAELTKDGKLSRAEAQYAAETISSDPVMTEPAKKEAYTLFAKVGSAKSDAATREAIKAEFSLRATGVFQSLDVPGRVVVNGLPKSVRNALAANTESEAEATWESSEVRKTTLAGRTVYIVHHSELDDGNGDAEKVTLFSADGKKIASGAIWDGMAGFGWD